LLGWLLAASTALAAANPDLFSDIPEIENELSSITGLPFKHHVAYAVIGREQLRRYLDERTKDALKPEEVRAQELILKMLGLIPQEFDLRKTTVDLLTEQAAAFYDYHKKKLFVLESEAGPQARAALTPELAHALADQHCRLDKYIREGSRSDDGATARLAVMEGQASWLMAACLSKESGGPPVVPEPMLNLLRNTLTANA